MMSDWYLFLHLTMQSVIRLNSRAIWVVELRVKRAYKTSRD